MTWHALNRPGWTISMEFMEGQVCVHQLGARFA
jgi:hypothetical protein